MSNNNGIFCYSEKIIYQYATIQKGNSVTIESYTYDYAGNRTSKTINETDTTYYVNDTSSSLTMVVAETNKDGKEVASYTRGDELLSMERDGEVWYYLYDGHGNVRTLTNEAGRLTDRYFYEVRGEETSYYLFDGHGDVRALNNIEGRITDKYRYNAYGELIERSGEIENHYLYTGEYYDGTSNLYYLRSRYMNPSTGTFISMDTYEGSVYDPDTLHKYLYANGNPVKYSDPSGNFSAVTMAAGMAINDCLTTTYNVHLMGILSGLSNMAINSILGE